MATFAIARNVGALADNLTPVQPSDSALIFGGAAHAKMASLSFLNGLMSATASTCSFLKRRGRAAEGGNHRPISNPSYYESKVYIPILTQNYASSKWCLQELAKMVDCWKSGGGAKGQHIILPVFFFIDPRDVRHPDSSSYKEAFEQLSLKHDPETILEWKEALQEVGKMKGWHVTRSDGEKIIGIYGMGGLGKTTLAKAVYDKVSTRFERCCFLDNIRDILSEKDGMLSLQNKIISGILRNDSNEAKNASDGIRIIRDRVCRHKLLIVLDDVDEKFQFDEVLGKLNHFSMDSRFLITTRTARGLELLQECKLFELEEMSTDHSLKLFSKHAFGVDYPPEDYASLSKEFVQVATGLPLYIKGTDCVEILEIDMECEDFMLTNKEFKKLTRLRCLKLSNGRLAGNFKDVLPNLRWLQLVNCNSVPTDLNLRKLVDLELKDCSVRDGWKGWNELKVARKLKAVSIERCFNLRKVPDFSDCEDLEWLQFNECWNMHGEVDIRNFKSLIFLGISKTKITKIKGDLGRLLNLRYLTAGDSSLIEFSAGISKLSSLEFLSLTLTDPYKTDFTEMLPASLIFLCKYLQRLPDLSNLTKLSALVLRDAGVSEILGLGELKMLEYLFIEKAPRIVNLDGLENLVLLKELRVKGCLVLEKLPSLVALSRLEKLWIEIYGVGQFWESLLHLDVRRCSGLTGLEGVHSMVKLESLVLVGCKLTDSLPSSLSMFTKLMELCLSGMSQRLFPDLSNLKNLRSLGLISCKELVKVTGLDMLELLESLSMNGCRSIRELPDLSRLIKLKTLDVSGCTQLTEVRGLGRLESLEELSMSGCESIKVLPNLSGLKNLRELYLKECGQLKEVNGGLELIVFEADKRIKVKYVLKSVARYEKYAWLVIGGMIIL
ncbi:Disease resistance protein L6 [Linum grandiflorum]